MTTLWDKVYVLDGEVVGTRPMPEGMIQVYADDKYVMLGVTCVKTVEVE